MRLRRAVPSELRRIVQTGSLGLLLVAGAASAGQNPGSHRPNAVSGMLPTDGEPTGGVVFYDSADGSSMRVAQAMGFDVHEIYRGLCVAEPGPGATAFGGIILTQIIDGMDPGSRAEPDFFLRAPEGSGFAGGVLGSSFGRAAFQRQNALTQIRSRAAQRDATGVGVVVGVLDSGIDASHPLFAGRVLPGHDFVDADSDASEGVPNGIDEDGDGRMDDGFGHGTTVSGLVLAAAPDAFILPVRVLDTEGMTTAGRVAAGIRWAVDHGADVVNMSLGGEGWSSAVQQEILAGQALGVVFVAAAGNRRGPPGQSPPPPLEFPANVNMVIAVSGIGLGGPSGDVVAPWFKVDGPYPGGRWFRGYGTSFGTALASGGAALAMETTPGIDAFGIFQRLSPNLRPRAKLDLPRLVRK